MFDPTKTPSTSYRLGINVRARKNVIQGAYKPTKYNSPNAKHQALFVSDDKLMLVAGGELFVLTNNVFTRVDTFNIMDSDVDYIYHSNVPAPTNFFVKGEYKSTIATTPECTVLQDGINTPRLVLSNLYTRLARTYSEWSFNSPEYIPVGKQMAFSGNVLYIVSVDGKRIYQSVAGRPLDFTLNIDNDGNKRGDADTSYLAVSAAKIHTLVGAQNGGVIAFSNYKTYSLTPVQGVSTIYGQDYLQPAELFPVGAVNHTSFTQANGETLFVSSRGINRFNEVQQTKLESNLSPFGAPIVDYIVRPITRIACAALDDYTFFGLQTVFGDGVLVYDNQLQAFVGIDLVGAVKEFAVLQDNGAPRLFYITHTNELFEYNLFAGEKMDFGVYVGEFVPYSSDGDIGYPLKQLRPTSVEVALSSINTEGNLTVEVFVDKQTRSTVTKPVRLATTQRLLSTVPVSIPLEGNADTRTYTFNFSNEPFGYTASAFVFCTANTRITCIGMATDDRDIPAAPDNIVDTLEEDYLLAGNWRPDMTFRDADKFEVDRGGRYYLYSDEGGKLLNGKAELVGRQPTYSQAFIAAANILYLNENVRFFSYLTAETWFGVNPGTVIGLGNYGYDEKYGHFAELLLSNNRTFYGLSGPQEWTDDTYTKNYSSKLNGIEFRVVEGTYVRFFLVSFRLNHAQAVLDDTGNLESTPDEMLESGAYAQRIAQTINNGKSKINIVCFHFSPRRYAALAWNFKRLGVNAVFSSDETNYTREYEDGVLYVNAGTMDALNIDGNISIPGGVVLHTRDGFVAGEYVDTNGVVHDKFSITK